MLRKSYVVISGLFLVLLAGSVLAIPRPQSGQGSEFVPKAVLNALKAKFPQAVIDKWTREKEDGIILYDIEFKQQGRKFEADVKEDGTIHNWEKAVAVKDIPVAVSQAVTKKYPKASLNEVMEVTNVKNGKDKLEGYEIAFTSADKKEVEVTVAPDGKILEDSGEKQDESN